MLGRPQWGPTARLPCVAATPARPPRRSEPSLTCTALTAIPVYN